ncbi:MAG: hypothetical protein KDA58_12685 [Planctomycetaceae bacterium]|nr:hypothetical protein [Planctomycetaceae bacterium]
MADEKPLQPTSAEEIRELKERPHPVLAVLAGFLLAFLTLAFCVCGGAAWWFRPQISDDVELAEKIAHEIVEVDIPTSFQPRGAITWNVAFTMRLRGAYYELFAGDGLLSILEVQSRFRAEADVRNHIHTTLLEKGGGGALLVIDDTATTRQNFTIHGQEVPFTFQIGKDPARGRLYHLVEGVFEGRGGEVLVSLRIDDDSWDQNEVELLLRSLGHGQIEN